VPFSKSPRITSIWLFVFRAEVDNCDLNACGCSQEDLEKAGKHDTTLINSPPLFRLTPLPLNYVGGNLKECVVGEDFCCRVAAEFLEEPDEGTFGGENLPDDIFHELAPGGTASLRQLVT